jgi:hypothetical protein
MAENVTKIPTKFGFENDTERNSTGFGGEKWLDFFFQNRGK